MSAHNTIAELNAGIVQNGGTLPITGAMTVSGASTVGGASTVSGASTVAGVTTPTGGVAAAGGFSALASGVHVGGSAAAAAGDGTDSALANGTLFVGECLIAANMTITGVSVLVGTTGGTDKFQAILFNSAGDVVAKSADAGITVGSNGLYQDLVFTATYAALGPATYYIGINANGNTAKLKTHLMGSFRGNSVAQTFGTPAAIVPGTLFSTRWTASKAPYASLY